MRSMMGCNQLGGGGAIIKCLRLITDYGGGVHVPDYGNQMRVQKPKIFACGAIF